MKPTKMRARPAAAPVIAALCLAGCAAPVYTVDDGSPVDEKLLADIRTYGKGQQALRPAIIRTAALKDKDCSKQYELPFIAASSYDLPKEKKIAWVRGLAVDERLTIIGVAPGAGLVLGDKIEEIDGYKRENTRKMTEKLIGLRDSGDPFDMKLAGGKVVKVTPVEVCRGYTLITPPDATVDQSYHWLESWHQLPIFATTLTEDEALWMTLWTQGLSEEAGARMKTYHYGMRLVKTGIAVASIASGVGSIANAANAAAATASAEAGRAASQAALEAAGRMAAEKAADRLRQNLIDTLQKAVVGSMQDVVFDSIKAATIFKSTLTGISWVASSGFYMADKWAFERMTRLNASYLAPFTLQYKLASKGLVQNAFLFDEERLQLMRDLARPVDAEEKVEFVLQGIDTDDAVALAAARDKRQRDAALAALPPEVSFVLEGAAFSGRFALDKTTNRYSGQGRIAFANGDVYEGHLEQGMRSGPGRMTWANGQSYEGTWRDDKPAGTGKMHFANGNQYEGDIADNVPSGRGVMRFASGDRYEGDFSEGVPHGAGAFLWASGDRYDGAWNRNLRHGQGTFTWRNGDAWEGLFAEGQQTEQGVLRRAAGPAADSVAPDKLIANSSPTQ